MRNKKRIIALALCAALAGANAYPAAQTAYAASKDVTNSMKNNKEIKSIAKNINLLVETSSALSFADGTNKVKLDAAGKVDAVCAIIMGSEKKDGIDWKDGIRGGSMFRIKDAKIKSLHKKLFGSAPSLSNIKMGKNNLAIKKNNKIYFRSGDWGDGLPTYKITSIKKPSNNTLAMQISNDYKDFRTRETYHSQGTTDILLKKINQKYVVSKITYTINHEAIDVLADKEAYSDVFSQLQPGQAFAFAKLSNGTRVLLVTDYTYVYDRDTIAAIDATVYGKDASGNTINYGKVQSAGTAYPLSVSAANCLYYGSGHSVHKVTQSADFKSLNTVESALEIFDENGNATYYYNDSVVPNGDNLQRLFSEWLDGAKIIDFSIIN